MYLTNAQIKNKAAAHWRDHIVSLKRVIHPMETLGEIHFQCSLSDGGWPPLQEAARVGLNVSTMWTEIRYTDIIFTLSTVHVHELKVGIRPTRVPWGNLVRNSLSGKVPTWNYFYLGSLIQLLMSRINNVGADIRASCVNRRRMSTTGNGFRERNDSNKNCS